MAIEELIVKTLNGLPPEKQQEVLDFAQFLATRVPPKATPHSVKGLLADLNIRITAEDIDEARREMWGNFPREEDR